MYTITPLTTQMLSLLSFSFHKHEDELINHCNNSQWLNYDCTSGLHSLYNHHEIIFKKVCITARLKRNTEPFYWSIFLIFVHLFASETYVQELRAVYALKPSGRWSKGIHHSSTRLMNRGFCFYLACLVAHTWLFTDSLSLKTPGKHASRLHGHLGDGLIFPWLSEELNHWLSSNKKLKPYILTNHLSDL